MFNKILRKSIFYFKEGQNGQDNNKIIPLKSSIPIAVGRAVGIGAY